MQYCKWANLTNEDFFWTDAGAMQLVKNHLGVLAARTNTFTGKSEKIHKNSQSCKWPQATDIFIDLQDIDLSFIMTGWMVKLLACSISNATLNWERGAEECLNCLCFLNSKFPFGHSCYVSIRKEQFHSWCYLVNTSLHSRDLRLRTTWTITFCSRADIATPKHGICSLWVKTRLFTVTKETPLNLRLQCMSPGLTSSKVSWWASSILSLCKVKCL